MLAHDIPGAKFVEIVNDAGRPPKLRCKRHNRYLLTYIVQVGEVASPVCMECLADTGVEIDRAVCGRGSLTRMVPRIPGTAIVAVNSPHKSFICKWCTESFETYYQLQEHYQDCDVRTMGLRPAGT